MGFCTVARLRGQRGKRDLVSLTVRVEVISYTRRRGRSAGRYREIVHGLKCLVDTGGMSVVDA